MELTLHWDATPANDNALAEGQEAVPCRVRVSLGVLSLSTTADNDAHAPESNNTLVFWTSEDGASNPSEVRS